ncbi:hypothetical protein A3K01_04135 [candidate division WWE3 bacterium RIFOXYD1_FULL_43_17]|uniref:Uncharacterized protein n=2 Tax=Katanobacteria TaxID=422282 RepID=A0A1F4XE03_UNCKA|nr:MAG: hypothetical protein UU59_C0015G0011 [candidate division WWE3 bacterium GW2011_GWE1_41_27]OGC79882.1 MAG: hypothetical protein A3K01_04135 [candidate division WWE3 bacterium RIFOXYD1_FULL_43_17]
MKTNVFCSVVVVVILVMSFPSCSGSSEQETNPFQIGQTIYPNKDYVESHYPEHVAIAIQGGKVVDITRDLVRIEYNDGSTYVFDHEWFQPLEMELSEVWMLGNPFHVGDYVCAVPDSIRESFPDAGNVSKVQGELIQLNGSGHLINWAHFQLCK